MAYLLGLEGSFRGKRYCFKKSFRLGNEPECNIFLHPGATKKKFKVEIIKKGHFFFLYKDPFDFPLLVNGEEILEGQIFHGSILCIEKTRFLFSTLDCQKSLYEGERASPCLDDKSESGHLMDLYHASNILAAQLELTDLLHQMGKFLEQVFSCSKSIFFLEDKSKNFQTFFYPKNNITPHLAYREISSSMLDLLYKGKSIYWKSLYPNGYQYFIASLFSHQKQNLGFVLLVLDHSLTNPEHDLYLLSRLCLQASSCLTNIEKYKEKREFNNRLESLNKITLNLSCLLEKEAICREAIREICNILQCTKSALFFLQETHPLNLHYSIGLKEDGLTEVEKKILSTFRGEKSSEWDQNLFENHDSSMFAPVYHENGFYRKAIAVLYAGDSIKKMPFSTQDKEILSIIARQVGVAFSKAILYEQATIDYLTKLYLRSYFMEKLEHSIQSFSTTMDKFSLLMLDLDHFKKVNDTYGHTAGDHVLKEIAEILKNSVRENDIVARYGGEEFVILLKDTDYSSAMKVAERIRANVENFSFPMAKNAITISIGLAEYCPLESSKDLILRADRALYCAKNQGRNRVCFDEK